MPILDLQKQLVAGHVNRSGGRIVHLRRPPLVSEAIRPGRLKQWVTGAVGDLSPYLTVAVRLVQFELGRSLGESFLQEHKLDEHTARRFLHHRPLSARRPARGSGAAAATGIVGCERQGLVGEVFGAAAGLAIEEVVFAGGFRRRDFPAACELGRRSDRPAPRRRRGLGRSGRGSRVQVAGEVQPRAFFSHVPCRAAARTATLRCPRPARRRRRWPTAQRSACARCCCPSPF